jgi:hypothetical protein
VNEVNKLRKGKRKRSTRTFFFFFCPEYFYVCLASDVQLYIPSGVRGGLNILSFILRYICTSTDGGYAYMTFNEIF